MIRVNWKRPADSETIKNVETAFIVAGTSIEIKAPTIFGEPLSKIEANGEIDLFVAADDLITNELRKCQAIREAVVTGIVGSDNLLSRIGIVLNTDIVLKKAKSESESQATNFVAVVIKFEKFAARDARVKSPFAQLHVSVCIDVTDNVAVGCANWRKDVLVDGCSESVKTVNAKNPATRQGNALDAKTQAKIVAKSGGEVGGGHLCAKIDVYTEGGVLLRKISLSRHII